MSLYERIASRPGGRRDLAAARLRYAVTAALQHAGLDVRRPGRLRVDRLAELLHDAGYELEIRAVPAGEVGDRPAPRSAAVTIGVPGDAKAMGAEVAKTLRDYKRRGGRFE